MVWFAGGGMFAQVSGPPAPGGDVAAETAAGTAAAAAPATDGFGSLWTFMPLMLGVMLIFMLISGRPQQKEQARVKKLLTSLKKNDRVVTAGGIIGSVVNAPGDSEYVTIRIDESNNTKLQLLRQSIVRVIDDEPAKTGP